MSIEIASAADIATGAGMVRNPEPAADDGRSSNSDDCLNCGTKLRGLHCYNCGQKAKVHRTLVGFGHDILHSVLHFDGKIWRTLPLLIWHPGELTRRYIDGERAKFVSPVALFLFTVFLSFAVFSVLLPNDVKINDARLSVNGAAEAGQPKKPDIVAKIAERPSEQGAAESNAAKAAKAILDDDKITMNVDFFENKQIEAMANRAANNPKLFLYKVQSNAYKFSWALIPISLPFVWILFFWKRRFRFFDHAVFVTYSMTFMLAFSMICGVILSFAEGIGTVILVSLVAVIYPHIHWYRQIRYGYEISAFGAAWRTFALSNFSTAALGIFAILIFALGIA